MNYELRMEKGGVVANINMPIGKLFKIEKGQLQSTKCTPGKFDFITAAEDWKTHNQYNHECEALIFAAAASGSLGRTHYVDGKFISSDLCYILTPKDEKKYPLNLAFYHFVFNSLRPVLVAATKSGTSKESINQTNFKKYEFPYFDIEQQDFWIERLKNTLIRKNLLCSQLTHQQTLLKKLRQQILQEAIQGKLTADFRTQNPDIEPAGKLLVRIKAEKEQLIKEKKIKKQKPLPPISEEEIPFELPEGWTWCRVWDIAKLITSGSRDWAKYYADNGAIFITMGNLSIGHYQLRTDNVRYVQPPNNGEGLRTKLKENDLLISITGDVGNLGLIPKNFGEAYINQHTCLLRFMPECQNRYFPELMRSPLAKYQYNDPQRGIKNSFRLGDVGEMIIPLPPLPEQKAIATKVEKLLSICDQLETQITTNQTHTEQLMQAVLKEAFSQSGEA